MESICDVKSISDMKSINDMKSISDMKSIIDLKSISDVLRVSWSVMKRVKVQWQQQSNNPFSSNRVITPLDDQLPMTLLSDVIAHGSVGIGV